MSFLISARRWYRQGETLKTSTLHTARSRRSSAPSANPSRWSARLPVAGLAAIGLGIASSLAAYQLGFVRQVWEPFFGDGSRRVLHSFVSTLLPVPDAAVGAAGYAAEFIATLGGGADRSRVHPPFVLVYGAIVASLAVGGLILTGVQAFVLHAGCTLCLLSALISVVVAAVARKEVVA
ncbi:MAG: hypothetical protein DLM52_10360, partial [Chthoniobacterales bacterium]